MSDKISTNIWVKLCSKYWSVYTKYDARITTHSEYTLVHNNPEYHVTKKTDVDGDVVDMLRETVVYTDKVTMPIKTYEALRNALIAQSDPDMVRIPRKVLEEMKMKSTCGLWENAHNGAINDVLNYKEGK